MNSTREYILFAFNVIRCIPHVILFHLHKNKAIIVADMKRGFYIMERKEIRQPFGLIYLLAFCQEYRNLFYYRTRPYSFALQIICHQLPTLYIQSKLIGEGLSIVHGFSTAIGAESIGRNCVIYQQVTIGGTKHGAPKLLNNVTVYAGAVIVGKIVIGNNVVIGANATVYKSVPDNSLVLPGTSKVMGWTKRDS